MIRITPLATAAAIALLAGCAGSPPPDPRLADVRTRLDQARGDATIARYSQAQLREAEQSLAQAQRDEKDGDRAALDHDLYMAQRQLDVAQSNAQAENLRAQRSAVAENMRSSGHTIALTGVLFAPGKANLRPGAANRLREIADDLKANPNQTATVEGFTDSSGSADANRALSQARADAVKRALVADGIDPSRITTRGMGEDYPVASNSTAAGRQQNRRVEVVMRPA